MTSEPPIKIGTVGALLKQLRAERHLTQKELASRIDVTEELIGQYERGVKIPKPEQIDRLSEALHLDFEDRAYLYGLRGQKRKTPSPSLTDREVIQCLQKLNELQTMSQIPVIILKYDFLIFGANKQARDLTGIDPEIIGRAVNNHISLFEVVFNHQLGLRSKIQNFRDAGLDLIRDFLAVNILRRAEPFYRDFPDCFQQREWFLEFKDLWNTALSSDPYIELLKRRGVDLGHEEIVMRKEDKRLAFYISRHAIPTLANEYRIIRFIPLDDTVKAFPPYAKISSS